MSFLPIKENKYSLEKGYKKSSEEEWVLSPCTGRGLMYYPVLRDSLFLEKSYNIVWVLRQTFLLLLSIENQSIYERRKSLSYIYLTFDTSPVTTRYSRLLLCLVVQGSYNTIPQV